MDSSPPLVESLQLIDDKLVEKAIGVVLYNHQENEDSLFLQLCALNFLNAAIKTEVFKNKLSYDLIKSNAAKLIKTIDTLKKRGNLILLQQRGILLIYQTWKYSI